MRDKTDNQSAMDKTHLPGTWKDRVGGGLIGFGITVGALYGWNQWGDQIQSVAADTVVPALGTFGQYFANTPQFIQDSPEMAAIGVGAAAVAVIAVNAIEMGYNKFKERKPQVKLLKHSAWRKYDKEIDSEHNERTNFLISVVKDRLASSLSNDPEFLDRKNRQIDDNGNVNEKIKKNRADAEFFQIIDNLIDEIRTKTNGDRDAMAREFKKIIEQIETKRNKNKHPIRGRIARSVTALALAATLFSPIAQGVTNYEPAQINASIVINENDQKPADNPIASAETESQEDDDYESFSVTEHALKHNKFKQGDLMGTWDIPRTGYRVPTYAGYEYVVGTEDPETNPVTGYNTREIMGRTGNAVFYNSADRDINGQEITTLMPGDRGIMTCKAHNGYDGGFTGLEENIRDGDILTFTSGDVVFTYMYVGKIPIAFDRSGAEILPATVRTDVKNPESYYVIMPDGSKVILDQMDTSVDVINNVVTPWSNGDFVTDSYFLLESCTNPTNPNYHKTVTGFVVVLVSVTADGVTTNVGTYNQI